MNTSIKDFSGRSGQCIVVWGTPEEPRRRYITDLK